MKRISLLVLILFTFCSVLTVHRPPLFAGDETENQEKKGDDEKVDSVWGAFKFTGSKIKSGSITAGHGIKKGSIKAGQGIKKGGKATGRGFKKAGSSIKKFFAGD